MATTISSSAETDEQVLRKMVMDAVENMNRGDVGAFGKFWDVEADYVGVDGRFLKGRKAMEDALGPMIKAGAGKVIQHATVESVRFLKPELAIIDGSWTINVGGGAQAGG